MICQLRIDFSGKLCGSARADLLGAAELLPTDFRVSYYKGHRHGVVVHISFVEHEGGGGRNHNAQNQGCPWASSLLALEKPDSVLYAAPGIEIWGVLLEWGSGGNPTSNSGFFLMADEVLSTLPFTLPETWEPVI